MFVQTSVTRSMIINAYLKFTILFQAMHLHLLTWFSNFFQLCINTRTEVNQAKELWKQEHSDDFTFLLVQSCKNICLFCFVFFFITELTGGTISIKTEKKHYVLESI